MPRILVVEPDATAAGRIEHALQGKDWDVVCVSSIQAAMQTTAEQETHAVVIGPGVDSPHEVVGTVSHGRAGGVPITVLSELAAGELGLQLPRLQVLPADASADGIAAAVQDGLDSAPAAGPAVDAGRELTSEDLFGDVVAEVERPGAVAEARRPAPPVAEPPQAEPARAGASPAPAAKRKKKRTSTAQDVDRVLEETFSGVQKKTRKPAVAKSAPEPVRAAAPEAKEPAPEREAIPEKEAVPAQPVAAARQAAPPAGDKKRAASVDQDLDRVLEETLSGTEPKTKPSRAQPATKKSRRPAAASDVDSLLGGALKDLEGTGRTARKSEVEIPQAFGELERKVSRTAARAAESPAAQAPEPAARAAEAAVEEKPKPAKKGKGRRGAKQATPREEAIEFGSYQLVERIALGGMAEVWRARMRGVEGFAKMVAIKKILPHLTDNEEFSEMFVDEAKLAAQLTHNNIIHIYDFGKIGDEYFIAMEYVEGKDLRAILSAARRNGEPLPLGLALLIGSRLASALRYAHRKKDFEDQDLGLVHRDVSPQNVLISYEGDIKLCDFGIAKAVSKVSKTQIGALKGKVQYMSPEQAWGETVDARSDIFSLGALLFEMLTGERLFAGGSELSILEAVREGRVRGPRTLNADVPEAVDKVVLKALAKDPKNRYQTAGELQSELEACLQEVHPTPTVSDLARYVRGLFSAEEAATTERGKEMPRAAAEESGAAVEMAQPIAGATEAESGPPRWMLYGGIAAVAVIGALLLFWLTGRSGKPAPEAASSNPPVEAAQTPPAGTPAESMPSTDQATKPAASTATMEAISSAKKSSAQTPKAKTPAGETGQASKTIADAKTGASPSPTPAKGAAEKKSGVTDTEALKKLDAMVAEEVSKREEALRKKMEAEQERLRQQIQEANKMAAAPGAAPSNGAESAKAGAADKATKGEAAPAKAEENGKQSAASVKPGELVKAGKGVTPPQLVSSVKPNYPAAAADAPKGSQVVVSALVDETGAVIQTRVDSGVDADAGINEAAVAAVRAAQFKPATKDGVKVKMWYKLTVPVP